MFQMCYPKSGARKLNGGEQVHNRGEEGWKKET